MQQGAVVISGNGLRLSGGITVAQRNQAMLAISEKSGICLFGSVTVTGDPVLPLLTTGVMGER
jgi:hypothetical protein